MSAVVSTAIGSVAVASLVVAFMMKKKMTISEIADDLLHTPYFHSKKKLGIKDEVIIGMLESCQDKGPCYVITDPALEGKWEREEKTIIMNIDDKIARYEHFRDM